MTTSPPSTPQPKSSVLATAGGRVKSAAMTSAIFVALLWVIEGIDAFIFGGRLDFSGGIIPLSFDGLNGVLFAPFLHADFAHLAANSVPAAVLTFFICLWRVRVWVMSTLLIAVVAGAGTWLFGGLNTVHIGASGLIYGWLTFLIVRGIANRSWLQTLVGVGIFFYYGTLLFGVLPGQAGISWQGHLFGAIGGVLAAFILRPKNKPGAVTAADTQITYPRAA